VAQRVVREARDELVDVEATAGRRVALGRRRTAGVVVITVVVAVLVGVASWRLATAPDHYSDDDFVAATTERVSLLLEADSSDPTRARRILSGATGEFHDSFAQSADAYSQYIESARTRGSGAVDGVALARRDGESALMLVAASVRITTADGTDDEPSAFRMRVQMTPEDGELKIAGIEVLS
jgi:Mce-associated membrane protein